MGFEQEPDYNYLRGLFKNIMNDRGYTFDYKYDWVKKSNSSVIKTENLKDNLTVKKESNSNIKENNYVNNK
jgi:hypothetical protein